MFEHPLVCAIFTFEGTVWGNVVSWLYETDVRAGDMGSRMLAREMYRPYSCACSYIKDLGGLCYGSKVKALIEQQPPPAILEICDGALTCLAVSPFCPGLLCASRAVDGSCNLPNRSCSIYKGYISL